MTREEIKELLPIIQAFAEGKIIQYKNFLDEWTDIEENEGLSFICPPSDYRIKPQSKYRPFKSQEECWNEMLKHQPFGFLSIADKHDYFSICRVFEEEGKPKIWLTNNTYGDCDMTTAFVIFQFIDGTPFGINKEK